jgi:cysteine-rich repeat protein
MKSNRRKVVMGVLGAGLALGMAGSAAAVGVTGRVYCDANRSQTIDAGDQILVSVGVTATSVQGSFSDLTNFEGGYFIDLPNVVPMSYDETLDPATLPADAVIVGSPAVQSFEVTPTSQAVTIDWLVDSAICHVASCGDGVVDTNEQCDDGNNVDGDGCSATCTVEAFCGDGTVDPGEQCDDGNNQNGDGCSATCTFEGGGEGCTPGYWKQRQHFDSYPIPCGPSTRFVDAFGVDAFPGKTLLNVLKEGGGGLIALGRHAVAALLNATSDGVDYDATPAAVIASFEEAYTSGSYEEMKDVFETFNELGCPLN